MLTDNCAAKCGSEQPIERGSAQTGRRMQNAFFRRYTYVDARCAHSRCWYVRENYGEIAVPVGSDSA
jgi:hypothetical protein